MVPVAECGVRLESYNLVADAVRLRLAKTIHLQNAIYAVNRQKLAFNPSQPLDWPHIAGCVHSNASWSQAALPFECSIRRNCVALLT
jgi:hypothetical protein